MFEKFKTLFEKEEQATNIEIDAVQLAVSSLMISTALHDGEFDDVEKKEIMTLLRNYYSLEDQQLTELFDNASILLSQANDIHQFTSKINSSLSDDEKLEIIEMLWKIVIADGKIDDYENALIRKISGLLYIDDFTVGEIKKKLTN